MKKSIVQKTVLSAMFLALGFVLPLLTGQIKEIGQMLLPMHIPVMLCGLMCGAQYGFTIGLILPILRAAVFGMPPIYPNSIWMALELATYGLVIGIVYSLVKKNIIGVYISLIASMIAGRIVWGIAKAILLGLGGKSFGFAMFITGGFVEAFPGIILQLLLIPLLMVLIEKGTKGTAK